MQERLFGLLLVSSFAGLASLQAQRGERDLGFPETVIRGTVRDIGVTQDGAAYVGGDLQAFRDQPTQQLVKILPNGELDPNFSIGEGFVDESGRSGRLNQIEIDVHGRIYVAGLFHNYNGVDRAGLARLHPNGSLDLDFDPDLGLTNGSPVFLVMNREVDAVYVTGGFHRVDDLDINGGLVRLQSEDGRLDPSFEVEVPEPINGSLQRDGRLIVITEHHSVRLAWDGSLDRSFVEPLLWPQTVRTLPSGDLLSLEIDNFGPDQLLRYQSDGRLDATFSAEIPRNVVPGNLEILADGQVVLGGRHLLDAQGKTIASFALEELAAGSRLEFSASDQRFLWVLWRSDFGTDLARYHLRDDEDQRAPEVEFAHSRYEGAEALGSLRASVRRRGSLESTLRVPYRLLPGSAVEGTHYLGSDGVLQFDVGEAVARIEVALIDDELPEGVGRTFQIELLGDDLGDRMKADAVILDDEIQLVFFDGVEGARFTADLREGGVERVRVRRTGERFGPLTVEFEVIPGTATRSDFSTMSGEIHFADGQAVSTISGLVIDDVVVEQEESARLRLIGVDAGALGKESEVEVVIGDNDRISSDFRRIRFTPILVRSIEFMPGGGLAVGGQGNGHFGVFRADGTPDPNYAQLPNGEVRSIVRAPDGNLLVGGKFTGWGGTRLNRLARLLTDGSVDPNFISGTLEGPNGVVERIVSLPDGRILLAGDFDKFSGVSVSGLVRITDDGELDPEFQNDALRSTSGLAPHISELELTNAGQLYIASEAFDVPGMPSRSILRLHADGTVDERFRVASTFKELAMALS